MKNIENEVLEIILNNLFINKKDIEHLSSGKCSDLFIYKNPNNNSIEVLKIVKWHIKNYDTEQLTNDFAEKISVIKKIINLGADVVGCLESNNTKSFDVIRYDNENYVYYKMNYIAGQRLDIATNIVNYNEIANLARTIKKFHNSIKDIPVNANMSWVDDFVSVKSICNDERLLKKLNFYYEKIKKTAKKNYGYIHYDLNKTNFLSNDNKIVILDFDTLTVGWHTMDIAGLLFSISVKDIFKCEFISESDFKQIYCCFINEYNPDYSREFLEEIDLFMKYRRLFIYIILHESIKNRDPKIAEKFEDYIFNDKSFFEFNNQLDFCKSLCYNKGKI